jgi:superkiller protein 3
MENYVDALECAKRVVELTPDDAAAYDILGEAYCEMYDDRQALAAYKKSIQLNPNYCPAYISLCRLYQGMKDFDKELEYVNKAIEISGSEDKSTHNAHNAFLSQGCLYMEMNRYWDAMNSFNKMKEIYGDDDAYAWAYYYHMGKVYLMLKKYSDSILCYQKYTNMAGKSCVVCVNMGIAYYNLRNIKEAIRCYKNALKCAENDEEESGSHYCAYFNMGEAYYWDSNYPQAIFCYQKAVKLNPTSIEAYNAMAAAYKEQDRTYKQAECLMKAAKLGDAQAWTWLRENGYKWE